MWIYIGEGGEGEREREKEKRSNWEEVGTGGMRRRRIERGIDSLGK